MMYIPIMGDPTRGTGRWLYTGVNPLWHFFFFTDNNMEFYVFNRFIVITIKKLDIIEKHLVFDLLSLTTIFVYRIQT